MRPETEWRPVDEPPDPLPEAVDGALREATVTLWADLWQSRELLEIENWALRLEVAYLRGKGPCPRGNARKIVTRLFGPRRKVSHAAHA